MSDSKANGPLPDAPCSACPFLVGQRVRDKFSGQEATVLAVDEHGFRWKLDRPHNMGARIGWYQEGTCLPAGYDHYESVPNEKLSD